MAYLEQSDYARFGLSAQSAGDKIARASLLLNAYLKRPEGLVVANDASGAPAYMAGGVASSTWKITGDLAIGSNVAVGLNWSPPVSIVGETLLLDRSDPSKCEAVQITAVSGKTITAAAIANAHATNANLEAGFFINETVKPIGAVPFAILSRRPVVRIVDAASRFAGPAFGLSDRFEQPFGAGLTQSIVQSVPVTANQWNRIDPNTIEFERDTGQIRTNTGLYSELRLQYVAGYATGSLPDFLKMATAQLVSAISDEILMAPVKSYSAGDTEIVKFCNSAISGDVRMLLQSLRVGPRL